MTWAWPELASRHFVQRQGGKWLAVDNWSWSIDQPWSVNGESNLRSQMAYSSYICAEYQCLGFVKLNGSEADWLIGRWQSIYFFKLNNLMNVAERCYCKQNLYANILLDWFKFHMNRACKRDGLIIQHFLSIPELPHGTRICMKLISNFL